MSGLLFRFAVIGWILISAVAALAQDAKDDGICPPCERPDELQFYREMVAITNATVVIVTPRNKRNSTAPRILMDIESKGSGCRWVTNAASQLHAIGVSIIKNNAAAVGLPHVQYALFVVNRNGERDYDQTPSNRIIRVDDLVDFVRTNKPGSELLSRGRVMAKGDAAIERCLPRMNGGPEGESWERMYGTPAPRDDVRRKMLPMFICIDAARTAAERQACAALAR